MGKKISRRYVLAGAAMASLSVNGAAEATRGSREQFCSLRTALKPDPVAVRVAAWLVERDAVDAMMRDWRDQEVALCAKIRPTGMSLTHAYRCGLPEARAMRALDRRIKRQLRTLERDARRIVLLRPSSAEGALAKIRMGLKIQGPYDWEDYAFALAQDGCEQLALLLAQSPRLHADLESGLELTPRAGSVRS